MFVNNEVVVYDKNLPFYFTFLKTVKVIIRHLSITDKQKINFWIKKDFKIKVIY